ncbi:MAG: hypothetical protein LQ340_000674 [Diploschistes diacapsis]|nr:MAG: hypothetical protein LQ340_000674 [Diploschistes diacapsis]
METTSVAFTVPKNTPTRDYLICMEHISLHVAQSQGGAQFYLSCAQVYLENGGFGTPAPLSPSIAHTALPIPASLSTCTTPFRLVTPCQVLLFGLSE